MGASLKVLMVIMEVMFLEHLASPARSYRTRQPRSDVTLLSVIRLKESCETVTRKLTQHESYQIQWEGQGTGASCKLSFLAENPYNVMTEYKICFRFLVYDIEDCGIKVRFSESAWMYFNYVYDTREYSCKDRMPINQWCSGWHGQAWISLLTASWQKQGKFTMEVTAIAKTSLTVAACVAIVLSCLGSLFLICIVISCVRAKRRRTRGNIRRSRLSDIRNMRMNRANRILMDSSASFPREESNSQPFLFTDFSSSFLRPPQTTIGRSPSLGVIGRSTPIDEDNISDIAPSTDQISSPPPSYHTIIPQAPDGTDSQLLSDQTENMQLPTEPRDVPPPTEQGDVPPPSYNTINPPPSYEECMQYTIT
ncbi:uncharacterized protein LOC117331837 [Pecten maximus]|uniref:uncharacterized protein LOC117331837 n=1 Tax=Pecten maximus TaxID=6579 RepID=UPI0014582D30|nr:uncharacterized protein LOC117331837 [Pecten maximus]